MSGILSGNNQFGYYQIVTTSSGASATSVITIGLESGNNVLRNSHF
jgi:hypothetical protein